MYCNITIPLPHGDEGCYLIVTEATWVPEEYSFRIDAGYTVEGYDFDEVHNLFYDEIQKAMKSWWADDRYQSINWEDVER